MTNKTIVTDWQAILTSGAVAYAGIPIVKAPTDFFHLQSLIYQCGVVGVIEIGNWRGGMLLAYDHWLRAFENSAMHFVIGVDIDHTQLDKRVRLEPCITLCEGDAMPSRHSRKSKTPWQKQGQT